MTDAVPLEWVARNALGVVIVAAAVLTLTEATKRAAHGAGADLEGRGWQRVLRWVLPYGFGALVGAAVPDLWAAGVSAPLGALLGFVGGGPAGRFLYRLGKDRVPGMLTSRARTPDGGGM